MQQRAHRFASLDGLRIVGALMVVTTHVGYAGGSAVTGPYAGLLARMDAGVALFFVVSGFLLYRPHARVLLDRADERERARIHDTRTYARHRFARIAPAAWVAVLASALLLPHTDDITPWHYVQIASMVQIYVPHPSVAGLTQMWSLSTEVAFYVLLPVFAWLLARVGRRAGGAVGARRVLVLLAATPLVSIAWILLTHGALEGVTNLWLPGFLGWFGGGAALALWHEGRLAGVFGHTWIDELVDSPGTLWSLAAALYLLLSTRVSGPFGLTPATEFESVVKNVGYTLFAVLAVLPCVHATESRSRIVAALGSHPARELGAISYGVFCYHLIVLRIAELSIDHEPFSGRTGLLWILTVAGTLPLAWVSHRYLEAPLMRRARRGDGRIVSAGVDTRTVAQAQASSTAA
ncbi:acyltransferase [Mobilicoccus sp.]|uniref:acyltransferase family protein n=1 Tax=Mobilicoccus sp. TaxID=2034349 RepID=UPI002898FBD7|nr:acyltransferase [Mobilicoccus sp.]